MPLPIESVLEQRCRELVTQPEARNLYRKELRAAVSTHSYDSVIQAFDIWAESQYGFTGRRPISTFLRSLSTLISVSPASRPTSSGLKSAELKIALISDSEVVFGNNLRPALSKMIQDYSLEIVTEAFKQFYQKQVTDDYAKKFAAKNFIETGDTIIQVLLAKKKETEDIEKQAARGLAKLREEAERDKQIRLQQEAEEAEALAGGL